MWGHILILSIVWCMTTSINTEDDGLSENNFGQKNEETNLRSRSKRYALQGSRWSTNEITYRISKYSTKLPKRTVDKIIKKAVSLWAEVTNLKFVEQKEERKNGKKVKLDIRFEKGQHGDDAPFDGPGGFRAHAFFPGFGGDLHLDDDEDWTDESSRDGVRLLLVATHEIGHALGVGHSKIPSALMAPSHKEWKGDVKLTSDDIKAIQGLYGKPGEGRPSKPDPALGKGAGPMVLPGGQGGPPFRPGVNVPFRPPLGPGAGNPFGPGGPPPIPPPLPPSDPPIFIDQDRPKIPRRDVPTTTRQKPPIPKFDYDDNSGEDIDNSYEDVDSVIENAVDVFDSDYDDETIEKNDPDLCQRDGVDTMITHDEETYAFKGDKYWKLADSEAGVAAGYPRRISEDWEELPDNIDAAFTWKNGKMYFLKGSRYWRYSSFGNLDTGFPKKISNGFGGIPDNIDAAFVWKRNGKIYFFKGNNYWKFNPSNDPPVDNSYPRPISNWKGVPGRIDAALQYKNGNSYFFKNNKYYRFNAETLSVERGSNPPYPRDTGEWWFGCTYDDVPRRLKKKQDRRFILD